MPKVSNENPTDHGPVVEASGDLGGYTVNIVEFRADLDHRALLKGLPGDSCHCPHWGYVIKGRMTYDCGDHEEVFEAGDAFYLAPGHIPVTNEPGTLLVQFSPPEQLAEVNAAIMSNMQAMQAARS
jgi:hypothetical protein